MNTKRSAHIINDFNLDADIKRPIYLQISQRIKNCIAQSLLKPGDRVPSSRSLANELGVSRGTVDSSYNLLIAEGFLTSHAQAGTYISANLAGKSAMLEMQHANVANIQLKGQRQSNYPLPFQMGLPALDNLPRKLWSRLGARTLRSMQGAQYAYPDPQGVTILRERIAAYLQVSRGVICRPEQVYITSGYRNSLTLLIHAFFHQQQPIHIEDPCFLHTKEVLSSLNLTLSPIDVDQDGLQTQHLSNEAQAVIVTPAHQSPTSVVMTLTRRLELLEWAANSSNRLIIEDDYDGEFHYASKPLPALKSLDRNDSVIYMGSFSKVLFPSIRLSYVVIPERKQEQFSQTIRHLQNGCDTFTQLLVAEFMHEGHFMRHIQSMRRLYKQRYQYLSNSLNQTLDKKWASVLPNSGGMHLILELQKELDEKEICKALREDNLAVESMSKWTIKRQLGPALMLGFTNIADKQQADSLVARIKKVLPGH